MHPDINTPGEAEAILARSRATADGLRLLSESMKAEGGAEVWFLFLAHVVPAIHFGSPKVCMDRMLT